MVSITPDLQAHPYSKPILVTGATGYVGGRLVPQMLDAGYTVRAMGRSLSKLEGRPWAQHPRVELVKADTLDAESMNKAAKGCQAGFYLVHSMISKKKAFAQADKQSVQNMIAAASAGGLERIIYLGGLGEIENPALSKHLRSRHEVGDILQAGPVPTTVLRAAMILGAGSASFEMLRYLTERLPVMITPKWVRSPCQSIAIQNVLNYLQGCLEQPATTGQTFDIGGPDILDYQEIINIFTDEAGLSRRWIIPVPVLTPKLSAYWVHLVTPVPSSIAIPLTEGLGVPVICKDNRIRDLIPQKLLTVRESIRLALQRIQPAQTSTRWTDAGAPFQPEWTYCGDADWSGGTTLQSGFRCRVDQPIKTVWQPIQHIGGTTGWYFANNLWKLRGMADRLIGGIGLRRGRRDATRLNVGDVIDFWRIIEAKPPHQLRLLAEMKLPGQALMDIELHAVSHQITELRLVTLFFPLGLLGMLYWYSIYPLHQWVYRGMTRAIATAGDGRLVDGPHTYVSNDQNVCRLP